MKIKDLIELLQSLDAELPVLKSSDGEGNSFSFVGSCKLSSYEEQGRELSVGIPELTDKLISQGYSDEDVRENLCVCLW